MSGVLTDWLDRIGIGSVPDPTVETLGRVIRQQLRQVAFENLMVLGGKVPALDRKALARKIVAGRRGGYCFELNGLMAHGLEEIGFGVRPKLARVLWQRSEPGPRTHLFLAVEAEGGTWLADAGFGGPCPDVSIPIGPGADGHTPEPFSLSEEPGLGTVLSRRMRDGRQAALYAFQEEHVSAADIEAANWLAATYPASIFRSRVMAALGDSTSRRTLDGERFSRQEAGAAVEETTLGGVTEVARCLAEEFGLSVDTAEREAIARAVEAEAA
jgi:N-hydroxyarylamine O-acetyltransferase